MVCLYILNTIMGMLLPCGWSFFVFLRLAHVDRLDIVGVGHAHVLIRSDNSEEEKKEK